MYVHVRAVTSACAESTVSCVSRDMTVIVREAREWPTRSVLLPDKL